MARVSMNEFTTYRWSFEEDVHHYRDAGYDGIGVWRDKLADFGEEKGAELLSDSQLAVSSLLWAGGFTGSDGRSYRDAIADGLEAVRLAALLQAESLVVHSGARGGHTNNHVRRLFRGALEKMLQLAEPLGVTLALEPMHCSCSADWTFLEGLDEMLGLIGDIGSERMKLAFDCYHLGHDEAILARLPDLVPHLAIVQLGDARNAPRGEQNRCRLGDGVLAPGRLVASLLAAGYDGFFEVELIGEEIESVDYYDLVFHSRQAFEEYVEAAEAK
jgi:sugar phosphate isomerase/epimerase